MENNINEQNLKYDNEFLNLNHVERLKKLIDLYFSNNTNLFLDEFESSNFTSPLSSPLKDKTNKIKDCDLKLDVSSFGVEGIDSSTTDLNKYEKCLIDRLTQIFYHSREDIILDLSIQKKLVFLYETENEENFKKLSKVILANFIVQPVKRVITFAKLIPDFRNLDINDQMCLLQGGTMEIFICTSSSLYDQVSNKLSNIISKERNIRRNDSSIELDILKMIWSEEIFERTVSYLKSMSELKIDETTLILYIPLILFSSDRRGLADRQKIESIQSKYSFLLKKYMIWKYGPSEETTKLYNKLILKLIELRSLQEMHSSILLDADPHQLEPFSLAFIENKKEEVLKF